MNGKKNVKIYIIALSIIAGIIVLFMVFPPTSFFKKKEKADQGVAVPGAAGTGEEIATQVKAFKVQAAPFEDVLALLGTIKGMFQVELKFEVNGIVSNVNYREGDIIKKGDVIATLDQKDAILKMEYNESKLRAQQSQALVAKKRYENTKSLYDAGAVVKAKLEEVELEYKSAISQTESSQKEVEFAKAELDKTYMRSPMDGVLASRDVDVGESINQNSKIGVIFDIKGIYVEAGIIEKDINKVRVGQKAKITVDAYSGVDFFGTVDNIPSLVEGKSRTLPCKIKVDNPRSLLKPGMFARCDVYVFQEDNVLMVPSVALKDTDGDNIFDAVYTIEADDIAKLRKVTIGYVTTDYTQVLSGLAEGELVITEAGKKIEEGSKVEITETAEGK